MQQLQLKAVLFLKPFLCRVETPLDNKHITKKNALPGVDKACGAMFSSYGGNFAVVMKKVSFLLVFPEMLMLYRDRGCCPSSEPGDVKIDGRTTLVPSVTYLHREQLRYTVELGGPSVGQLRRPTWYVLKI